MDNNRQEVKPATEIELHLRTSPELPRKYGRLIKAIGGHYSSARLYDTVRFVHLPLNAAGMHLANILAEEFSSPNRLTPVLFRGGENAEAVEVQYILPGERVEASYRRYFSEARRQKAEGWL